MGQSLVAGAGLKVRGLICDMVVRFRTSLVTKRALLAKNAMGYHYIDHKHWLEASITLVYHQATSSYIGTIHILHMHTYPVSIRSHAKKRTAFYARSERQDQQCTKMTAPSPSIDRVFKGYASPATRRADP